MSSIVSSTSSVRTVELAFRNTFLEAPRSSSSAKRSRSVDSGLLSRSAARFEMRVDVASESSCGSSVASESLSAQTDLPPQQTTVVIRRLPVGATRTPIMRLLAQHGFEGTFDFLCMPINHAKMETIGCAFVNFKTHEVAQRAFEVFQGMQVVAPKPRQMGVSWANAQGVAANVAQMAANPMPAAQMPEELRPFVQCA